MKKLSKIIISVIIDEFGEKEFFQRISNPIFFQSFSNVLGFDWNSSGVTTVMTGVLKSVLNCSDFNIRIAGGKGNQARKTPEHIKKYAEELDVDVELLVRNSKLSARIDGNALQDGYDLYHHAVIFSENYFTVIQQGMNAEKKLARRYHFAPSKLRDVELSGDVHSGIISVRKEADVINLVSEKSKECRKTILDIIKSPDSLKKDVELISVKKIPRDQSTLGGVIFDFAVPARLNWNAVERAYDLDVDSFEDFLLIEGMGKATVRALALIADLIYNSEYDRQDPAKYSFALGGKDGVPFPVNTGVYDETIQFLSSVIEQSSLDRFEKEKIEKKIRTIQIHH
jgi:hypothetical protein